MLLELEARAGRGARLWPVLRACAQLGDPLRAEAWLRRGAPDLRAQNAVLHAYAKVDLKDTERALRRMVRSGLRPSIESFNAVLAACAREKDIFTATKWFHRVLDAELKPDQVTYRTLVSVCARAQNLPLAEEWLRKMLSATNHGLDIVSCSSIIGGYASQGDAESAESWLDRMLLAGLRPGGHAFNPVICAWSYVDPTRAEAWLWKALEAKVRPSDAALLRILAAYVRDQDINSCERLVGQLKDMGRYDARAVALLCKPHMAAGDFKKVEELVDLKDETERSCRQPQGLHTDVECLRLLLAAYARSPQPPRDGRVEDICERLGDAMRNTLSTPMARQSHARRVVGSCQEIAPAE